MGARCLYEMVSVMCWVDVDRDGDDVDEDIVILIAAETRPRPRGERRIYAHEIYRIDHGKCFLLLFLFPASPDSLATHVTITCHLII